VTLTGHVPNDLEKHAAEQAAAGVKGVQAIAQDLAVRLTDPFKHSDEDVARAAIDRVDLRG